MTQRLIIMSIVFILVASLGWMLLRKETTPAEKSQTTNQGVTLDGAIQTCESLDVASQDSCFNELAQESGDADVCDNIQDSVALGECYTNIATTTNNTQLCNNAINSDKRNACLLTIAATTGNVAICQQITNPSAIDSCIYGLAIRRHDSTLCASIASPDQQISCNRLVNTP